jgi:OmpA-OmpF porin, OOP family
MKTIMKPMVAAIAAMLFLPAMAQSADSKNQGYLVNGSDSDIVMSGTGLCWHTSDWTPARAVERCDPVNKPVVAAPAPARAVVAAVVPAPAPAPVKPVPQKISFSGDALFAFDKSVLKPEGKVMLDGLVSQLEGATYDNIVATGHTDRFGSNAYNQKLSERRANAVKDYLVSKNVQAGRIDAEGKGETQPVTKAGDCRGAKSVKVVACLQPDRRVDVVMKGMKTVTGSR